MDKGMHQEFRRALGQFATGVAIVTALDGKSEPVGLTVNSLASVSLEPPMVLWSIDRSSPLYDDFSLASHYAVHVLDNSQQSLSSRFADDNEDKFAGLSLRSGRFDLPLLDRYIARLQCEVVARHEAGDHLILVGQVCDIQVSDGAPLLFFSGRYRELQRDAQ